MSSGTGGWKMRQPFCLAAHDTRPEIADSIRGLQGSRLDDIVAVGAVPEIRSHHSQNVCNRLRSMALTVSEIPNGPLGFRPVPGLSAKKGTLWHRDAKTRGQPR